jgi:hypothetical protein
MIDPGLPELRYIAGVDLVQFGIAGILFIAALNFPTGVLFAGRCTGKQAKGEETPKQFIHWPYFFPSYYF